MSATTVDVAAGERARFVSAPGDPVLDAGEQAMVGRGTRHTYRGVPGRSSRRLVRISPGGLS